MYILQKCEARCAKWWAGGSATVGGGRDSVFTAGGRARSFGRVVWRAMQLDGQCKRLEIVDKIRSCTAGESDGVRPATTPAPHSASAHLRINDRHYTLLLRLLPQPPPLPPVNPASVALCCACCSVWLRDVAVARVLRCGGCAVNATFMLLLVMQSL